MRAAIVPKNLHGRVAAIPSKSDAHRLLICAALADKPSFVAMQGVSEDIVATAACLEALGAQIERRETGYWVEPIAKVRENALLDCGESGSTLRFMLPVAAALGAKASFTGRGRLPQRPLDALKSAMEAHGIRFSAEKLPFEIEGRLTGGEYALPGNISSQYITGLLLALPLVGEDSHIRLTTRLESAAYVEMTLSALKKFGVSVEVGEGSYHLAKEERYLSCGDVRVDGDWSNAAFFLCAGAIGEKVTVTGLDRMSLQGDKAVVDLLERFGAKTEILEDTVTVTPAKLQGCVIDVRDIPDLVPVLAVVAAAAEGETRFINAGRLRSKESDRIYSVAKMINSLGGCAREFPEELAIAGGTLRGGRVDAMNDHRIAMAAAIGAIRCEGEVMIEGAQCVGKSYPGFYEDYRSVGGIVHGI